VATAAGVVGASVVVVVVVVVLDELHASTTTSCGKPDHRDDRCPAGDGREATTLAT
jgi:hypothetical protein